jgi:hypothetical protein
MISPYKQIENQKEKIKELRRTIDFLCLTIAKATNDLPDSLTRLTLKESINDSRYTYR